MTPLQYKAAKEMLIAYDTAATKWRTDNKTNGMPADICATMPFAGIVTNELRSAIEIYEFINDIPAKYFLYIDEKKGIATTWMGDNLGNVHFGREYKATFGDKRQPIDVYGINGRKYHGTYYKSAGTYALIKLYKNQ